MQSAVAALCFALLSPVLDAYKVVVLGDIHGDYDYLISILRNNGVIDQNLDWVDPTTKVVSVGDTIGRGHQDKDVLEFIKGMTERNPDQWFQQLGNHEIMQLRNDWRYAVDGDGIGFGSLASRQAALREGSVLGDWLRGLPAIQKEADTIFIHAGMYDRYNVGRSLDELNAEIAVFLDLDQPRHVYNDLIWDRELVGDAFGGVEGTCDLVRDILGGLGASRLIIGHTPVQSLDRNANEPLHFCNGTFVDVDVGISRWMYGNPVNIQLEIDDDGKTTSITELRTVMDCMDNPAFRDEQGYRCSTGWQGYDCYAAASDWGYTPAGQEAILEACPASCGLCR